MPLTNRARLVKIELEISQIFGLSLPKPNIKLLQNYLVLGHDFAEIDEGVAHAT